MCVLKCGKWPHLFATLVYVLDDQLPYLASGNGIVQHWSKWLKLDLKSRPKDKNALLGLQKCISWIYVWFGNILNINSLNTGSPCYMLSFYLRIRINSIEKWPFFLNLSSNYSDCWSFYMWIHYMRAYFWSPYLSHITRSTCTCQNSLWNVYEFAHFFSQNKWTSDQSIS
jgi:hypothetical protein